MTWRFHEVAPAAALLVAPIAAPARPIAPEEARIDSGEAIGRPGALSRIHRARAPGRAGPRGICAALAPPRIRGVTLEGIGHGD